jgi:hypothetical protein
MGGIIILGGDSGGFEMKRIVHETVICPKYYDEIKRFSWTEIRRIMLPNGGILEIHRRVIVLLRCGHEAVLGNIDSCFLGTLVCNLCIRMCGHEKCGLKLCVVQECRCGRTKEGVLYCTNHSGFMGLLSNLFE